MPEERAGISRRLLFKLAGATAAAAGLVGHGAEKVSAHDLKPTDPAYRYDEYEAIVNRRDLRVRQLYQWPNLKNEIIFANVRNGMNGFQFSYDLPANAIQVVVQAYASANAATYDDFIWEKYKLGERHGHQRPRHRTSRRCATSGSPAALPPAMSKRPQKNGTTRTMPTPVSRAYSGAVCWS